VVVIGAPGQVGTDLMRAMADWAPVGLSHADLEVTDAGAVRTRLETLKPSVVINCAAFHQVDECERRPDEAFRVNALGARNVAVACTSLDALAVYISTDYVFDGSEQRPYTEVDCPRPINVYGATKLAGEHLVAATAARALVVRIASVFGVAGASGKGGNFVETMIRRARGREAIRVVDDLVMSPTYAADAAAAIRQLILRGRTGVVHAANTGWCTWYAFAQAILDLVGAQTHIEAQSAAALRQAARRPQNSALDPACLRDLGLSPRPWQEALHEYLIAKGHLTRV
jgi:dTDP-4-dehydrorhamnose reductase